MKMGQTSFSPTTIGLTSSFDANFDAGPATTVLNGLVNLPALAGRNTMPQQFQVYLPFPAPYVHVPQTGRHFLWEATVSNTTNGGSYDQARGAAFATCTRIWAQQPTATQANAGFRGEGLVVSLVTTPPCTANVATFGTGCAGSNGTPVHGAIGLPRLGQSYTLTLANARPSAPAWLFLATQRTTWGGLPLPLDLGPFGAAGCVLQVPGTAPFALGANSFGIANAPLSIPNVAAYCGLDVYSQFVIADPANQLGFVVSNACDSRLGN
jgi:hypothetical protein